MKARRQSRIEAKFRPRLLQALSGYHYFLLLETAFGDGRSCRAYLGRHPGGELVDDALVRLVFEHELHWGAFMEAADRTEELHEIYVEDAAKFERDLPYCAGVTVIPGSGHSPQLDNPPFVTETLVNFLSELD